MYFMAGKRTQSKGKLARDYRHDEKQILRPESGAQDVFPQDKRRPPKKYRYDSSLAPELTWDESEARGKGEQLIAEVLEAESLEQAQEAARKLKSLGEPFLNWAGKAERGEFTVPSLPLFTHERLSTHAVLETLNRRHPKRGKTLSLFGEGNKSIGEKIRGAYEHQNGWQNRMILGDSLQVMNSMLQYEALGGKVQMVYMDPPYGIKFGSNFQPFVRNQSVKDKDDDSISREPEMVQAYRDTWELGLHSWLTYMRDRLLLAREMLTDSGSCFVQISDENVHHVREVMDEVFGKENFVSLITFRKNVPLFAPKLLGTYSDYIIWYAKNKSYVKYRRLYQKKVLGKNSSFQYLIMENGEKRKMTKEEIENPATIPPNSEPFVLQNLLSSGYTASCYYDFEFDGQLIKAGKYSWATTKNGMEKLIHVGRVWGSGTRPGYVQKLSDYPVTPIDSLWSNTGPAHNQQYVVQTSEKVIQRCMLMTTDPGDLVFDPTCGSGSTAYVAEQWGRRWITTDVSRVPLALARQRLLTAIYPYYELRDDQRGPAGGFMYKRKQNKKGEEVGGIVPHITLKSITRNEPPAEEVLVDKPETLNYTRISGPFCVEAVLPTPLSPEASQVRESTADDYDYIPRMIAALSMSGVQAFKLKRVRVPARAMNIHAEAELADDTGERIAVTFGPIDGPISDYAVIEAGKEASNKGYARLLVVAFAIDPEARQTVAKAEATFGIPALYVQANTDLVMSDLLKNTRSSQLFAVTGLPDINLEKLPEKDEDGGDLWRVTLNGLDIFDPATMRPDSLAGDDVPCWMLDTDYDGQCFRAGQIFFPRTSAWDKIRKAVRADFDDEVWDALRGNVSAPFIAGDQIAVKVLDDRGNELLVVKKIEE